MSATPSKANIVKGLVLDFIKGAGLQPACKPGFAHAMKLSYHTIDKDRLQWVGDDTLIYRYKFATNKASTGLFLAIMDELQTDACFGVGQPSAPGLSLQLQCEVVEGQSISNISELDVVNTVTKLGRTISFVKSDFIDPASQQLVAFGSHVKYMPTGNYFLDLIFNKKWAYMLYQYYISSQTPECYPEVRNLTKEVLEPHLNIHTPGEAKFEVMGDHVNPFGGLHGGCHAMLMELVGGNLLSKKLGEGEYMLESVQIEYIGAGRGSLQIVAQPRTPDNPLVQCVKIISEKSGRLVSEGKLRWTNANISKL